MAAISLRCPGEALVVAPNFYGPAAVFRFRPPPAGAAAGAPQHLSPSQTLPTRSAHGVGLLRSGGALWAAVPHYGGASSTVFSAAEGGGSSGCLDEDAPRFRMRHRLRSYRAVAALPFEVNGSVLVAISNYYNASTQVWRVAGGPTRHPELVAHLGLHAAAPLAVCGDRGLLCAAPGWGVRRPGGSAQCYMLTPGSTEMELPTLRPAGGFPVRGAKGVACARGGPLVVANAFPVPSESVAYELPLPGGDRWAKAASGPRLHQPFGVALVDRRGERGGALYAAFAEHGRGRHGSPRRWDCADGRLSLWRWTGAGWEAAASTPLPCLSAVASFNVSGRWFLAAAQESAGTEKERFAVNSSIWEVAPAD